ncbi:MAG: T9SS type A sorting domain-containing protein [Chitinophagaceae bacterium]|nr:T9SS type A sorting domain-containing protein [Chitinophagaceae bacterium]
MKKYYILVLLLIAFCSVSRSAIHTVTVSNFQFNPANLVGVQVGDTVRYEFMQGFHNASSINVTNGVPAGAAQINSGDPSGVNPRTYDYKVTMPGTYNYICDIHSSMVGTFTASGSLPATLKSFNLTSSLTKKPLFSWVTVSEENVDYFTIRRSYDGIKYFDAGKVAATGNSSVERLYSYTDNTLNNFYKYIYYTLAMIDKDGKQKLSKVLMFKNPDATSKLITQIGPNPIKRPAEMMVQYNAEKEGKMFANIFDLSGKMVMQLQMSAFPGLNNAHLHVCDLNAGLYNVQFIYNGIKENKRIIIQ